MTELSEFLLARTAERENLAGMMAAEEWHPGRYDPGFDARVNSSIVGGYWDWVTNPAAVLADCEAKRQIVATCQGYAGEHINAGGYERVLRLLALPYADHPAYREEWKPS